MIEDSLKQLYNFFSEHYIAYHEKLQQLLEEAKKAGEEANALRLVRNINIKTITSLSCGPESAFTEKFCFSVTPA